MPEDPPFEISPEQQRLNEILMKILTYQHSLLDGRSVELDELRREGVLSPADIEFLTSHSITYKPHRLSDYHATDMLHMPLESGGCVFVGPGGPPLTRRHARLREFQPIVESFLKTPRPRDELLLHIELSEQDGGAVAPEMICFTFQGPRWREHVPSICRVAAEFGLHPIQNADVQGSRIVSFTVSGDAAHTAAAAVALLSRGCGFADEDDIIYSAGALDVV